MKLLREFVLYLFYCAAATAVAMAMALLWRDFFLYGHGAAKPQTRYSSGR